MFDSIEYSKQSWIAIGDKTACGVTRAELSRPWLSRTWTLNVGSAMFWTRTVTRSWTRSAVARAVGIPTVWATNVQDLIAGRGRTQHSGVGWNVWDWHSFDLAVQGISEKVKLIIGFEIETFYNAVETCGNMPLHYAYSDAEKGCNMLCYIKQYVSKSTIRLRALHVQVLNLSSFYRFFSRIFLKAETNKLSGIFCCVFTSFWASLLHISKKECLLLFLLQNATKSEGKTSREENRLW